MNDIDKGRMEVREALKHLFKVIMDELPGDLEKEERQFQAEHTLDMLMDAEIVMVQNYLA